MITKAQALTLKHGSILHHVSRKNSDKTPMRVRVSGKVQTWKTRPDEFKIPVKYGLYESGYVDNCFIRNAAEWELP